MRRVANQSREYADGGGPARVDAAVRAALGTPVRVPDTVLAVSGGRDSMVLLHAAMRFARRRVSAVATFDHGSGAHATRAVALVQRVAGEYGLTFVAGRAAQPEAGPRGEAAWRAERWAFLRDAARIVPNGVVATAHTEDDQLETVFIRALRSAGPRGLAGLYAASPVVRPFVEVAAREVAEYAALHRVEFVDDPSNTSRRHLRNRVRHELLPAIARQRPGFRAELLALARRAAAWRAEVERLVDGLATADASGTELSVPQPVLGSLGEAELAVVWPAIAARAGVTLDRRGTHRLAGFTRTSISGDTMPLSGGAHVRRARGRFVLRRGNADISRPCAPRAGVAATVVEHGTMCGAFRFRASAGANRGPSDAGSAWEATFDVAVELTVRPWMAGDRMAGGTGGTARRVKRFFADAHIGAHDRSGWPVVLADGAIVWIPGVRRSDAATVRPGRPGVRYECDRIDR